MTRRAALQIAGAFTLGAALCAVIFVPVILPVRVYRAWCGLVYDGAIPSTQGLLLTVREAKPGEGGPGPGPWVVAELRNVSRVPLPVATLDRLGDELALRVEDVAGGLLEPARPVGAAVEATWVHTTELAPGARLGLVCDVGRWARIPEPGDYRVWVERVAFEQRPHGVSRSNSILVKAF